MGHVPLSDLNPRSRVGGTAGGKSIAIHKNRRSRAFFSRFWHYSGRVGGSQSGSISIISRHVEEFVRGNDPSAQRSPDGTEDQTGTGVEAAG